MVALTSRLGAGTTTRSPGCGHPSVHTGPRSPPQLVMPMAKKQQLVTTSLSRRRRPRCSSRLQRPLMLLINRGARRAGFSGCLTMIATNVREDVGADSDGGHLPLRRGSCCSSLTLSSSQHLGTSLRPQWDVWGFRSWTLPPCRQRRLPVARGAWRFLWCCLGESDVLSRR